MPLRKNLKTVAAEKEVRSANLRMIEKCSIMMKFDNTMWDESKYKEIEKIIEKNTPVFPNRHIEVTDKKYAYLVSLKDEWFYDGNKANTPAATDSPLTTQKKAVWYYGAAINQAIKDISDAGGGYVHLPPAASKNGAGIYYAGAIHLKSNVYLSIDQNATLRFMRNQSNHYYPVVLTSYEGMDLYNYSPCIYALNERNIAVGGGGLLDGQENMWNWRPFKKGYWGAEWVDSQDSETTYGSNGTLNRLNAQNIPVTKRIFSDDGHPPKEISVLKGRSISCQKVSADDVKKSSFRPNFIEFNFCENIIIEDILIRNTPFWAIHPLNSQNIIIRKVDLYSDRTKDFEKQGWNNDDGIDPESCQNILIEDNQVTVSDDGIAIKAGRNNDGRLRRLPCKNIIIRNSVYRNDGGESAAISVGSEMSAGVSDVFVHDIVFEGCGLSHLMKLKTNTVRGGYIKNIFVRNCEVRAINRSLLQVDSNYRETVPFQNSGVFQPVIENIFFQNITTKKDIKPQKAMLELASSVPYSPVRTIQFKNIDYYSSDINLQLSMFEQSSYISGFIAKDISIINPKSNETVRLTTQPIELSQCVINVIEQVGRSYQLKMNKTVTVTDSDFYLTGLLKFKSDGEQGEVKLFLDHDEAEIPLEIQGNGSFKSASFHFKNEKAASFGDHHLIVNAVKGISCETFIFKIRTKKAGK